MRATQFRSSYKEDDGVCSAANLQRGSRPALGVVVDCAMDEGAEARRKARSSYAVRVCREGDAERMEDDDALDWDRIPVDDRAAFVWQLSQEVYALAHLD